MSIKRKNFDVASARNELISLIDGFVNLSNSEELRSRVLTLIPLFHLLRKFGINIISPNNDTSARERILLYLQRYPLTIIDSEELLVISGITDYQRRIRELRVQFGWPIIGGKTAKSMSIENEWPVSEIDVSKMKPDEYIMLDTGEDRDAAHRWNKINLLRRQKISVKDKLIQYFLQNVGRQISGEELSYLSNGATEWARRTRELRTEEGWSVKTRNTGRPDLPIGVYILEDKHQAETHDRKIEDSIRLLVLKRDNFSCRKCGWNYSQRRENDPRHFLELHHLDYHSNKGSNTEDNLITICNVHHDEIHKGHLSKNDVLKWIKD